jgi:hypothetical protein
MRNGGHVSMYRVGVRYRTFTSAESAAAIPKWARQLDSAERSGSGVFKSKAAPNVLCMPISKSQI